MSTMLSLKAECDVSYLSPSEVTKRIVRLTVTANGNDTPSERLPLNICLALDRSASMSGRKLEALKTAAISLVDQLQERDMIGVLAFDSKCDVIAPATVMFREHREQFKQRISAIKPGNGTALLEAYLKSAGIVADHLLLHGVNEILLVTDGRANYPAHPDPKQLAKHASELRKLGIQTSVYGIGADIKPFYLVPLSNYGGGSYTYMADHGDVRMFQARQEHLFHVVARDTTLRIIAPAGGSIRLLGDLPHLQDTALHIPVGSLSRGQIAVLYLEILMPTGPVGNQVPLNCTLSYLNHEEKRIHQSLKPEFVYVDHALAKSAPRNYELRQGAALVRMGYSVNKALYLADEKMYDEAAVSLRQAISRIKYLQTEQIEGLNILLDKIENRTLHPAESQSWFYEAYRWQAMRKGA